MYKFATIGMFSLILSAGIARADGPPTPPQPGNGDGDCHGATCNPPTRPVCFNLLCLYEMKEEGHPGDGNQHEDKSCRAAATFNGHVTIDGGEVQRDSDFDDKVQLEVKCGDKPGYNGGARRLTDLLGSRIQGNAGPFPAITLPRGSLHTGPMGQSGDHTVRSELEFDTGDIEKLHGKCFIWTGAP